jgi:CHAT domain-containing protein
MIKPTEEHFRKGHCLDDDDFYSYLTRSQGRQPLPSIEAHLTTCARCRQELAELARILHPEVQGVVEMAPEPSPQEIENTLALIQKASRREKGSAARRRQWYRWGAAAAAILVAIGLSSAGLFYLFQRNRSQALYTQARATLQEVYAPQSPSELRLDLPFRSEATQRSSPNGEALEGAERLFNRALGVREGMRDAQLGLGYIHLRRGQFAKAEEAFAAILGSGGNDPQALLGRGVSRFEDGISSTDPILRGSRLRSALEDFESVLKLEPASNEARFDRIRAFYELGQHKQALQEIDAYLTRDPDSIWALKLRNLKTRILMNRSEVIDKEVYRAAKARDAPALETLVRAAPFKILPTIRRVIIETLAIEGQPRSAEEPDSADLQWAAGILASSYTNATGDTGYSRLLDFFQGLTPSQKRLKKDLHVRLEQLIEAYHKGDPRSCLSKSEPLIRGFESLKDYWELVRVHQLRGNAAIYFKADFKAAAAEYNLMLRCAELSSDPDLLARSLSSLGSGYLQQHRYDDALSCLSKLKSLAETHRMENWSSFASKSLGGTFLELNQLDESLQEYSSALAPAYRLMDSEVLITSLESLAAIMERMGRYAEAGKFYDESREWLNVLINQGLIKTSPEVESRRMNLIINQGYLALRMKEPATAEARFREALNSPLNNMRDLEALNRLGLAQAYFEEKKYGEADAELSTVLDIVARTEIPEIAWQTHSLKGFLLKQTGDWEGALEQFQRAQQILERIRSRISSADLRQSFFARRFDPFREAVSLLYELHQDPKPALEQADRAKGMTLREYLTAHAVPADSERSAPDWAHGSTVSLPLPPGMVTLEYFLSSDQLFLFLSSPQGTEAASSKLLLSELEATVKQYLDSIRSNDGNSFDALSRKLYSELIEPVRSKLESQAIDTLVILPDGPLHLVPFGSLKDSSGHYLLEKFTLSYAPSRSILQYCLSMNRAKRITPESRVLLMDGSANLAGASQELAQVAKIFSRNNRLVDSGDIPTLAPTAGNCEIIHFSGHANIYRGRPRLVFPGPRGETYLESSTIENWKLKNNRLVSLLGCSTGIGPVFDGETPWGLVPAFLNAGAPSLLLSLLPIDDVSAANLIPQFYDILVRGAASKAGALRQAQLSLLKTLGPEAQAHPNLWVPFVLVGDPR